MRSTDVLNTEQRLQICKECPIFSPNRGICNPRLYLNPETNEISTESKTGFIRGCGCSVYFKAKNPNNHCNANKW